MKTIEEAANKAIIDNEFFMADPNHPEFVDRGLEQMRACKWVINHIFSLPLGQRLTDEEREKIRAIYNSNLAESKCYTEKAGVCGSMSRADGYLRKREINDTRIGLLEIIFGASMFENKGGTDK